MTYTSIQSSGEFPYNLRVAHLYGDLMNTYGDNGNILMLKYVGEKLGVKMTFDIVSLGDSFKADAYDMAFFGGGQDYEQVIVSQDLPNQAVELKKFIESLARTAQPARARHSRGHPDAHQGTRLPLDYARGRLARR